MGKYIFGLFICFNIYMFSQHVQGKETIIYKYKKYEKFDLGELEIKGSIIAPGDLSTSNLDIKKFSVRYFERKDFDDRMSRQLRSLR